jgi:plastocyanin
MRRLIRTVLAPAALAVVLAGGVAYTAYAQMPAPPFQQRVTMIDNNAPTMGITAGRGEWGFAPSHVTVRRGESIVFDNPSTNFRPHSVTSISWSGTFANRVLESGKQFDSSPSAMELMMPGSTYTVETINLDPGYYLYYCVIHPWMVGTFTVLPAQ